MPFKVKENGHVNDVLLAGFVAGERMKSVVGQSKLGSFAVSELLAKEKDLCDFVVCFVLLLFCKATFKQVKIPFQIKL